MDIPADIMKAAKAAYEAMPLCYDGWDEDAVILCIARAIMAERTAERERCAKIAEEYGGGDYWGKSKPIAAAIRNPKET